MSGMYFSVVHPIKIAGKLYRPSICYPVTDALKATITKLAQSNLVVMYDYKVRFVSGKPYAVEGLEAKAKQAQKALDEQNAKDRAAKYGSITKVDETSEEVKSSTAKKKSTKKAEFTE